jgi:integrase
VVGDRLTTITQKTGAQVKRELPAVVVEALRVLSPDRPNFRPEFYLWGSKLKQHILSNRWGKIIAKINPFLNFIDETSPKTMGQPLWFHSHVLRDTFAVELILRDMKIEDVSKLLTHNSIKTTEQHYSPWVTQREQQLEAKLKEALNGMGFNAL